jgi:tetratricopeptide (TPR) repeat protein
MAPEQRVEVKLMLVRATGGEASWKEAVEILEDAARDIRTIFPQKRRVDYRLEVLNWRLKAANRVNDVTQAVRIRDRIEWITNAASNTTMLSKFGAATSACSLAAFELFYGSARRGLNVLATLEVDGSLPEHLTHRIRTLRGLGYQRMGVWDTSEYELRQAYAQAKKTNDVLQIATVLTNLSCTAMERGAWDDAEEHAEAAKKLHEALSTALDALIPLRLNEANLAFYRGNAREARSLYRTLYELAKASDNTEFTTEIEACLGLVSLQLRDTASAIRWQTKIDASETQLVGIQERFKVEWFWGYCNRRNDPDAVEERLLRVASSQERFDRVGALKLRWLVALLLPRSREDEQQVKPETRQALAEAGLGWFTHFSDRWRRLADGCGL